MKRTENGQTRRDFLVGGGRLAGLTALSSAVSLTGCRPAAPPAEAPPPAPPSLAAAAAAAASSTTAPVSAWAVDPAWPRHPDPKNKWAGCPAVKVDRQDRVWLTTRRHPGLEIYDIEGNFIRAWDRPQLFSEKGDTIYRTPKDTPNLHYLKFDNDGNVWVCDTTRHVVRKCNQDGDVLMTIGTPDQAGDDSAHLSRPADMDITPAGVFIADGYGNRRVVHYSLDGKFIKTWGKQGIGPSEFVLPHGVVHDSQNRLYVADRLNERIQIFDYEGKLLGIWRDLVLPWALLMTAQDELWVAGAIAHDRANVLRDVNDTPSQVVVKFNTDGRILQMFSLYVGMPYIARRLTGKPDLALPDIDRPGDINVLHDMAFDSKNNLYVCGTGGRLMTMKYVPVFNTTTLNVKGLPI